MKILVFFLFSISYAFADKENCTTVDPHLFNCQTIDQALPALHLMQSEISEIYNNTNHKKSLADFKQDVENYLTLHKKLTNCPSFEQRCPSFSFKQHLGSNKGITVEHAFSSGGSSCKLKEPSIYYQDSNGKILATQVKDNFRLNVKSQCQDGLSLSFAAFSEGFLIHASSESSEFESQGIAKSVPLSADQVSVSSPDGKLLRIKWEGRGKEFYLDMDSETKTFKDSNFIPVDQINSGTCNIQKQDKPKSICNKQRSLLMKHKGIKSNSEYECIEYVPVIKGVSSQIKRG